MGDAQLQQGNLDKAIENLQKSVKLDAGKAAVWTKLGMAFRDRGKPRPAADHRCLAGVGNCFFCRFSDLALSRFPCLQLRVAHLCPATLALRSRNFASSGRPSCSPRRRRSSDLPSSGGASAEKIEERRRLGAARPHLPDAKSLLRCIDPRSRSEQSRWSQAGAQLGRDGRRSCNGKSRQGDRSLQKSVKLDAGKATVWAKLGVAFRDRGKPRPAAFRDRGCDNCSARAIASLEKATQLAPNDPTAFHELGAHL